MRVSTAALLDKGYLKERAKLIGGTSELISAPGHGTTVRVTVPLS